MCWLVTLVGAASYAQCVVHNLISSVGVPGAGPCTIVAVDRNCLIGQRKGRGRPFLLCVKMGLEVPITVPVMSPHSIMGDCT